MITAFCGMKIEGWVSNLAMKTGRTPFAAKTQLEDIGRKLKKRPQPYGNYTNLSADDIRLMKGLCEKMLQWVR